MAKLSIRPADNNENKKPVVELVDLVKQFGDKTVLKDLNMAINKGEFVTILGASGSGKTTALRLIGGFEWPTRGEIKFNGVDVKDLPAYKRPTNTIFQDYALFPHLTVEGNIKYGLKLIRKPKENLSPSVEEKLQNKIEEWNQKALDEQKKLDKKQEEYQAIIDESSVDADGKPSKKVKQAQKWLDDSDFHYSYWETYAQQKEISYRKSHTTRKLNKKEIKQKVQDAIELIGLQGNEKKSIDQLSGGMKQRVALARAIVTEPEILLLDEPLSALDLKVRQKMQRELKSIQQELGLTFIFVTHDQEEAMTISDRIVVMREGRVEQFDTPLNIYEYPVNSWVADFIGESNIIDGRVYEQDKIYVFDQLLPGDTYKIEKGSDVKVMIRPEDINISTSEESFFEGEIESAIYQGVFWEYKVKTPEFTWRVKTTKKYEIGTTVGLSWTSFDIHTMSE